MSFPQIVSTRRTRISRWVELVEKAVQFTAGSEPEIYHCLTQAPYVGIFAQLPDDRIPVVRQFRPIVGDYTWEFPAGTVDEGESPEQAIHRELMEEAGLELVELTYLGNQQPDTGRLDVESHAFYGRCLLPNPSATPEFEMQYVSPERLRQMIVSGEFRHQLHIAIYGTVLAHGIVIDASAQ